MRKLTAWILTVLLLTLTGCGAGAEETGGEKQVFAMDTVMLLSASGGDWEAALREAEQCIYQTEERLSRTREGSDVDLLNRAGGAETAVSSLTGQLLALADTCRRETGGAFDVTIAPVADAWGFTGEEQHRPSEELLRERLALVDGSRLTVREMEGQWSAALGPDQTVDLGGIAKGYLGDLLEGIYAEKGVVSGTLSLGGDVYVRGSKADGTPWRVGIQDPHHPEDGSACAVKLLLEDAVAVTSGGYQRYFEEDGLRYHHIIDPATGAPAQSDLLSVTVVADANGRTGFDETPGANAVCDAFSTALFIMGEKQAVDFWRSSPRDFQLVLVTEDGRVVLTEGLANRSEQAEESGYVYETVS